MIGYQLVVFICNRMTARKTGPRLRLDSPPGRVPLLRSDIEFLDVSCFRPVLSGAAAGEIGCCGTAPETCGGATCQDAGTTPGQLPRLKFAPAKFWYCQMRWLVPTSVHYTKPLGPRSRLSLVIRKPLSLKLLQARVPKNRRVAARMQLLSDAWVVSLTYASVRN